MVKKENYTDFEKDLDFEKESMTKSEKAIVKYVLDRHSAMDQRRQKHEARWEIDDRQVEALVYQSVDGKAVVNMPLEQNQIEMYKGQVNPVLNYTVEPEGKANATDVMLAKYSLDYFVKREKIQREIQLWDYQSPKYGTGILSDAITSESKVQREVDGESNDYYDAQYKEKKITLWHIGLRNINIRKIRFDENGNNVDECMDCIYEEDLSIELFRTKYLDGNKPIKGFKYIKSVNTAAKENTADDWYASTDRNVIIRHYYNVITGDYYIIADKEWLIHPGKMTAKHGKLPFTVRQFYPTDGLYGISLPQKLESVKPYINNYFKVALDSLWMSVSPIMILGAGSDLEDTYIDPGSINIWKFSGDAKNNEMQNMQFQTNLNGIIEIIDLINDFGIQNTGINIKAPYTSPAKTAFQAGLQKEEQNTRMQSIYQLRDEALDDALTKLMSNIKQYAPLRMGEFLTNGDGNVEFKPFEIKIEGKKIKRDEDDKIIEVEDSIGDYDYFDLTDSLFEETGELKVRIATPTSQTVTKALDKAEFSNLLSQALQLKQIDPELNIGNMEDRLKRLEILYGFEVDKLYIKSDNDKREQKINEIMDQMALINQSIGDPDTLNSTPLPNEEISSMDGSPEIQMGGSQLQAGSQAPTGSFPGTDSGNPMIGQTPDEQFAL